MSAASDKVVQAAARCFADKGFAGTTIADIEAAAGYVPRTGGVYRHFRSKAAILEAVIDAALTEHLAGLLDVPERPEPADLRALLEIGARRALARLDKQAELMRIVFRDLDRFPDLMDRVRRRLLDATYRDFADRVRLGMAAGLVPDVDAEAVAVLAVGPIVDFKIKQHLLGYTPLDLTEERLVTTWVIAIGHLLGLPS